MSEQSKKETGMSKEIYEHIRDNIHLLITDLECGVILNRNSNANNSDGYLRIGLAGRTVYQHQILAVARWGERCIGKTIDHINANKNDNRAINLELVDFTENLRRRTRTNFTNYHPVKAINLCTGETFIFKSQREASRELGLDSGNIAQHLKKKLKRVGNYRFEKVDWQNYAPIMQ